MDTIVYEILRGLPFSFELLRCIIRPSFSQGGRYAIQPLLIDISLYFTLPATILPCEQQVLDLGVQPVQEGRTGNPDCRRGVYQ
jgi:hypothetical protein